MLKRFQSLADTCAVGISALCAVHCLALPVVLIVFPVLGGTVFTDELFHQVLLWFIVPTSVLAVLLARQHHPDGRVLALVGGGMLILAVAAFWAHEHAPPWVDTSMSIGGGALLALGHIRNFRLCRH